MVCPVSAPEVWCFGRGSSCLFPLASDLAQDEMVKMDSYRAPEKPLMETRPGKPVATRREASDKSKRDRQTGSTRFGLIEVFVQTIHLYKHVAMGHNLCRAILERNTHVPPILMSPGVQGFDPQPC